MRGLVTINTDAGWLPFDKVGSFAYWIKGDGFHLKGSGLLKGEIQSSIEAECKAIANALHVLIKHNPPGVMKIIINRDNIFALPERKSKHDFKSAMHRLLKKLWKFHAAEHNVTFIQFYEFRHVKAHGKNETSRGWVNNWCDAQCKKVQTEWIIKNKAI